MLSAGGIWTRDVQLLKLGAQSEHLNLWAIAAVGDYYIATRTLSMTYVNGAVVFENLRPLMVH